MPFQRILTGVPERQPKADRTQRLPPAQMPVVLFLRCGKHTMACRGLQSVALWDRPKEAARAWSMVTWVCPTGAKPQDLMNT